MESPEIPPEHEEQVHVVIDAGKPGGGSLGLVYKRADLFAKGLEAALPAGAEVHWSERRGTSPRSMQGLARIPGTPGKQTRAILTAWARKRAKSVEEPDGFPVSMVITMDDAG